MYLRALISLGIFFVRELAAPRREIVVVQRHVRARARKAAASRAQV
jgi:hypothetical protein